MDKQILKTITIINKNNCTHNLSEDYIKYDCLIGDYIVIDSFKGIILKNCNCNQEAWTKWQNIYFNTENNYKQYIKHGLIKSMKRYLK